MKKIILVFVFWAICHATQAQEKAPQKARGYLEFYGTYNQFNSLNKDFATLTEANLLQRGTGLGTGLRAIYGVFMLDGFWTNEVFNIKDNSQPPESRLRNNVYGGTLNVFLLPQLKDYITPYAGIGYAQTDWTLQHAVTNSRGIIQKKDGNIEYKDISKNSLQHIIWNVGIRAKIRRVSFSAAYRQSFDGEIQAQSFSQLSFSVGYNLLFFGNKKD